jgi:diaminopimelate epimerase
VNRFQENLMEEALFLEKEFFKGHGHGNDYLVFRQGEDWGLTPRTVRRVCDRWRGPGGDGIVVLLAPFLEPFRLRMFNPDGTEFERSGNGLRILGSFLFGEEMVEMGVPFPVQVGGEEVGMEILGREGTRALQVRVEMGKARFDPQAVAWRPEELGPRGFLVAPDGERLDVVSVSVGNPHCVVLRDELAEADLERLGPFLAGHPVFQNGTNVQLARPEPDGRVSILIWERGVGRTSSSGTSACAVAAACVKRGLLAPGPIEVVMEGGSFVVTVSRETDIRLEGPVQPLLTGTLSPELLADLLG